MFWFVWRHFFFRRTSDNLSMIKFNIKTIMLHLIYTYAINCQVGLWQCLPPKPEKQNLLFFYCKHVDVTRRVYEKKWMMGKNARNLVENMNELLATWDLFMDSNLPSQFWENFMILTKSKSELKHFKYTFTHTLLHSHTPHSSTHTLLTPTMWY